MIRTQLFLVGSVVTSVLLAPSMARAADTYFDTVGGDDSKDGTTEATAKKTIKITSGNKIHIKRGSAYSGSLNLNNTTVDTYGCGPRVIIDGILTLTKSSVEGLHVKPASGSAINLQAGNTVRDCEADGSSCTKSAMGITVMGENNTIIGNYIHDFSVSDSGSTVNNSGGAEGIMVMASNNEVAFNSVVNCQSVNTTLGGFEGGCLEIVNGKGAGQTLHNISFHHNYCEKSVGLFEGCSGNYSSTAGGVMDNHGIIENVTVSYNVSVDSMWLFLLQTVNTDFKNVVFANNTLIHTPRSSEYWDSGGGHFTMAIVYDSDTSTGTTVKADNEYFKQDGGFQPGTVAVRNNIFIDNIGTTRNAMMMANMTDHSNNLFVPANASVSFATGAKSAFALNDTEKKVDLAALALSANYELTSASTAAIDRGVAMSMSTNAAKAGTPLNEPIFAGVFSQDIAKQQVPCGSAPDIGASEYCDGTRVAWPGPSDASSCPGKDPIPAAGGTSSIGGSTSVSTGGKPATAATGGVANSAAAGGKSATGGVANTAGGKPATTGNVATGGAANGTSNDTRAAAGGTGATNAGSDPTKTADTTSPSAPSAGGALNGGDSSGQAVASSGKNSTSTGADSTSSGEGDHGAAASASGQSAATEDSACSCRIVDSRQQGFGRLALGVGLAALAFARRRKMRRARNAQ